MEAASTAVTTTEEQRMLLFELRDPDYFDAVVEYFTEIGGTSATVLDARNVEGVGEDPCKAGARAAHEIRAPFVANPAARRHPPRTPTAADVSVSGAKRPIPTAMGSTAATGSRFPLRGASARPR